MKSTADILKMLSIRIKKILWILGFRAFLLILILVFIDLLWGGFIFYKYVFLVENEGPKAAQNIVKFDVKTYQAVLGELQTREQSNSF